ncbi:glycosyltransferase [Methanobrevibacter filiformis]|uniref:GDP-mannose-dependent alpha-(1-6)-phosphatidylinositol monomannoside mannosyltransferase n=1 Tax=Methanobrevibacter filiformis TaxID=55758 RepID=A0A165ZTQ3_9EURY|nr:glycosyltransferase [Methanobrevibacter filiformis]KZX11148.1 GDP-mannose-dependent alpha-(1-6)-phosphatidylinositol monomannoside mannosyltransferase [Methanobrevibacter filiformis]
MDISLIARSFQTHKQGLGTYSKMLYESIKNEKDFNINLISHDDSFFQKDSSLDYLFYFLIEVLFKLRKSDIYHAISPLEGFYLNKKKSIVTIHDLIPIKMAENDLQSKLTKFLFEKAIKRSVEFKKIIVDSEQTAKELSEEYNVNYDNISIVRIAIDPKFFPKNIENDIFTIGTVSHLNKRKRISLLIESFLEANIPDSQLLIGGKGPELENLKEISNNDNRIKFLGFIPDEEMNDFYNLLDVFVFPTQMEGYGLPVVEAMACGKPVIMLKDAYVPADVKNKTHISSIKNLAKDLNEKNFNCDIDANLKFAQEHSIEKMGEEMIEIYKNMI